ncbi:hypothetical protein ABIA33_005012 [Streptacidiphilus sp. MAP12-16]
MSHRFHRFPLALAAASLALVAGCSASTAHPGIRVWTACFTDWQRR